MEWQQELAPIHQQMNLLLAMAIFEQRHEPEAMSPAASIQ